MRVVQIHKVSINLSDFTKPSPPLMSLIHRCRVWLSKESVKRVYEHYTYNNDNLIWKIPNSKTRNSNKTSFQHFIVNTYLNVDIEKRGHINFLRQILEKHSLHPNIFFNSSRNGDIKTKEQHAFFLKKLSVVQQQYSSGFIVTEKL